MGWEWSSADLAATVDTAVTSAFVVGMVATPVAEMRVTATAEPSAAYPEIGCCCVAEAALAAFVVVAAFVAAVVVVAAETVDFAVCLDRAAAQLEYAAAR